MARWIYAWTAIIGLPIVGTGCVERLLQVRSDPPGATVYLNGERIGETPVEHRFTFYGTVDVSLRARGYLAHRELKTLTTPWYQVFPVDLFSEFFTPWTIHDTHVVEVTMTPAQKDLPLDERQGLEKKADELRLQLPNATPRAESRP